MRLVNSTYGLSIGFFENSINTLVVEKPEFMTDIVQNIISQINGFKGSFVLSDDKDVKFDKDVVFVTDPFHVDLNSKKIMNKLYGQLEDIANESIEFYNDINKTIIDTLEKITDGVSYNNLKYNLEFHWKELYKLYDVKLEEHYDTLEGKLEEYIKVLSNIVRPKLVIFLNLKAYLEKRQMESLVVSSFYNKIPLLLIESDEKYQLENEEMFIVDKDRCLIVK